LLIQPPHKITEKTTVGSKKRFSAANSFMMKAPLFCIPFEKQSEDEKNSENDVEKQFEDSKHFCCSLF
jgi:hypothetical protein